MHELRRASESRRLAPTDRVRKRRALQRGVFKFQRLQENRRSDEQDGPPFLPFRPGLPHQLISRDDIEHPAGSSNDSLRVRPPRRGRDSVRLDDATPRRRFQLLPWRVRVAEKTATNADRIRQFDIRHGLGALKALCHIQRRPHEQEHPRLCRPRLLFPDSPGG